MSIAHRSPAWSNYLLKRAAGHYDFVVGHYYGFPNVQRSSFEDVVLTGNYQILDEILQTNSLLRLYNPGRDVYQCDSEWGGDPLARVPIAKGVSNQPTQPTIAPTSTRSA